MSHDGRVPDEDDRSGRCVERLVAERERRPAAQHEVDLLVAERRLLVRLHDVVARARRDVRVDPEGADVERAAYRTPQERALDDRDRLDVLQTDAPPTVVQDVRSFTETGRAYTR
jgi:hypothetical protein